MQHLKTGGFFLPFSGILLTFLPFKNHFALQKPIPCHKFFYYRHPPVTGMPIKKTTMKQNKNVRYNIPTANASIVLCLGIRLWSSYE
jgi:hypothetical protein